MLWVYQFSEKKTKAKFKARIGCRIAEEKRRTPRDEKPSTEQIKISSRLPFALFINHCWIHPRVDQTCWSRHRIWTIAMWCRFGSDGRAHSSNAWTQFRANRFGNYLHKTQRQTVNNKTQSKTKKKVERETNLDEQLEGMKFGESSKWTSARTFKGPNNGLNIRNYQNKTD